MRWARKGWLRETRLGMRTKSKWWKWGQVNSEKEFWKRRRKLGGVQRRQNFWGSNECYRCREVSKSGLPCLSTVMKKIPISSWSQRTHILEVWGRWQHSCRERCYKLWCSYYKKGRFLETLWWNNSNTCAQGPDHLSNLKYITHPPKKSSYS